MRGSLYRPVRAHFLDELRGAAILLVVAHHAAWDMHHLFGAGDALLTHPLVVALQPVFAGVFVFVAGMVCNTSRSNLRRGCVTLACALLVTLATRLALPQQTIRFGILHLLGSCMLLYGWGERWLRRCPSGAGFAAAAALFALCWGVPRGYLGWQGLGLALPGQLYRFDLGFVLGLPEAGFASGDYYPLLPWGLLFLAGSFAGRTVFAMRSPGWFFRSRLPALAWVGRHTLWVYLLHQPLLLGLMQLLL